MNLTQMSRRDFARLALGAGVAGAMPNIAFGHHTVSENIREIPVGPDTTANLVMGYIANKAELDLGKHVTDDARKYISVHLGEKSPETIWVGTNLDNVVLSDQIAWRTTEEGVKTFAKKMNVDRAPNMVDYLFPGDTLVLDLSKMSGADRAKVVARFGNKNINVTREELAGYTEKAYGKIIETQKAAIAKLKGIEPERVKRYADMDPLEFMVRAVEPGVGDSMYKGLKDQGVKFNSPVGYIKAAKRAAEPVNHRDTGKVGDIMIYFGVSYNRPGDTPGNIGFSAERKKSAHLRYMGSLDQLKEIIGASAYSEAWRERLAERTT